jgi:hypothetical protein
LDKKFSAADGKVNHQDRNLAELSVADVGKKNVCVSPFSDTLEKVIVRSIVASDRKKIDPSFSFRMANRSPPAPPP